MKPRTICHPEALADWRANDEKHYTFSGETNYATNKHTLSEKQENARRLSIRGLEEAIERENRKRGTICKEGEA